MHTQSFAKNNHNATVDDFFVPELCQPEALLSMVLLAELLVLVLVLAEPMTPGFDWVRLALTSLFVQWIVLLSAAVMCRSVSTVSVSICICSDHHRRRRRVAVPRAPSAPMPQELLPPP